MEEKFNQLVAQRSQATVAYYKATKELERADEVIKNLNAQINALTPFIKESQEEIVNDNN